MIPKKLWRIWLNDPMPEAFATWGANWWLMHPDWAYREIRVNSQVPTKLINSDLFWNAHKVVPKDWKRFQADLLRLELLWLYGGVYVDTDVVPLKPLDNLLDRDLLIAWSPNHGPGGKQILTQAVIGAIPGHPFIKACLDAIPTAVSRYKNRPLAQMVGPWHITRIWQEFPYGVEPLPAKTFYPQSTKERDRNLPVDLRDSYTWHRWNSSLRRKGEGFT